MSVFNGLDKLFVSVAEYEIVKELIYDDGVILPEYRHMRIKFDGARYILRSYHREELKCLRDLVAAQVGGRRES